MINDHHQQEQLQCGFVLAVDRGVHGDVRVEVLQAGLHASNVASPGSARAYSSIRKARRRNASWCRSRFSATTSCGVMCVTPESGSTSCVLPAASNADDSCKV